MNESSHDVKEVSGNCRRAVRKWPLLLVAAVRGATWVNRHICGAPRARETPRSHAKYRCVCVHRFENKQDGCLGGKHRPYGGNMYENGSDSGRSARF